MKLRVLLLAIVGLVGGGASYALADGGHGSQQGLPAGTNSSCQEAHVIGTVAAPQTFTVTVTKSGKDSPFTTGQVVTVSVGSTGQMVRVNVEGCSTGSTLSAKEAELHVVRSSPTASGHDAVGDAGDGDHQSTTQSTTTTTQTTAVTTGTTTGH